jgi:hypothetical protein
LSTLYARFAGHLDAILDQLEGEGQLASGVDRQAVTVEPPRDASRGDLATNAAMVLAKRANTNPRALAGLIAPKLESWRKLQAPRWQGLASSTSGCTRLSGRRSFVRSFPKAPIMAGWRRKNRGG